VEKLGWGGYYICVVGESDVGLRDVNSTGNRQQQQHKLLVIVVVVWEAGCC